VTTCISCSEALPDGARFCFTCGVTQTAPSCSSCGEDLVPGARFCFACGTPTGARGAAGPEGSTPSKPAVARRVTSVLFGDLVGFTSLSETLDQEDVQDLQSAYFEECRRVVGRYGGSVEKFIGDAVMAVWGVPTAHEDDAERAVRAGLELVRSITAIGEQLGVPGLAMRVGIVTGEVAVTVGAQQQGMVAGDAVNTASRVQGVATVGQVWVDETTRLLTSSAITYVDVGSHRLRGKHEPIPLWAVRAVVASVGGAQRADGLEAPLVGRDRELRVFQELFHSCEETQRPALIVVGGDAGVGKTRIAWEFEKYIDGLTTTLVSWHSGRCLAYGEGVAFYALAEAVRGRLRTFHDEDGSREDPDDAQLLERAMARLVDDEQEREWLTPRVGVLLGLGSLGGYAREDLFLAWTTFFERVGGDGSAIVLVIDDAQNADDGLVQFIEHLIATASFACFVVLLTRPGLLERHATLATNPRGTIVHLAAMSESDIAALLDGLVAGLPDAVRQLLVERAEGIPLFAVETVRSLIDRDLVVPRGGQYVLADPDALDLDAVGAPASLQALIAARLDTLTGPQRRLVDRASVLGESFSRAEIGALCPDISDVEQVLEGLVRLQILAHESRRFSAEFGQFQFVQSVVRQVAHGSLSRRDRKATHLAVVEVLERSGERVVEEAPIVAQHLLDAVAAAPGDPDAAELTARAIGHLRVAADRAMALGAPSEAVGHLRVAMGLATEVGDRAQIEAILGRALNNAGRFSESAEASAHAVELFTDLGDRVSAGRAAATQAQSLQFSGDLEAGRAVARPWYDELRRREDAEPALLELSSALAQVTVRLRLNDHEVLETFVQLAETSRDPGILADAYSRLALHYTTTGTQTVGRILLDAAANLCRQHHQPQPLVLALNNLAAICLSEDLDASVDYATEGSSAAAAAGLSVWFSFNTTNLLIGSWLRGDWEEAKRMLATVELLPEDVNHNVWLVVSELIATARREEAIRDVATTEPPTGDDPIDICWSTLARSLVADREDDPSAVTLASEAAQKLIEVAGLWDDLVLMMPVAMDLALKHENPVAAEALLHAVDEATGLVPRGLVAQTLRVRGLLARRAGRLEESEKQLRAALAELDTWGARGFQARTQAELAQVLRQLGKHEEAAALNDRARGWLRAARADGWFHELDLQLADR
jgi:class 3 adenylate cyclase/tetratricopeptide (TPR) repeat protein